MRLLLAFLTLSLSLFAAPALADRYRFDPSHTYINFYVNHLGFSDMQGRFTKYDGYIEYDEENPAAASVNMSLSASGIRTSSDLLDLNLQSTDFFITTQHPEIRFTNTNIDITGESTADITGDLTLLGVMKPVVLHVRLNKADYNPI